MQKRQFYLAVAGITLGLASSAQGAITYGYAEQTLTNVRVTGTLSNIGFGGLASSAASAIDGTGVSTNGFLDTLQAYQGAPPPAPQNSYVKYSTAGGGAQAGDFTRGDAVMSNVVNLFTTGFSGSTVAESATGGVAGLLTGTSTYLLSGTFNAPTSSSVTISYNYLNDIITIATAPGAAQAKFSFLITIKDTHGNSVDASPNELNATFASPPNGPEVTTSGAGSVVMSLAGLTSGDLFSITLTGQSAADVTSPNSVPEPSSAVLFSCAAGLLALRKFLAVRSRSV